jgi:hypothetical protein
LFPIRAKGEVGDTLLDFVHDVGIPSEDMIMPNKPWEEILILLQMTIKFQGT